MKRWWVWIGWIWLGTGIDRHEHRLTFDYFNPFFPYFFAGGGGSDVTFSIFTLGVKVLKS